MTALDAAILAYLSEMEWVDARTISQAVGRRHATVMARCQIMRDRGVLMSRWQTADEAGPGHAPRVLFGLPKPVPTGPPAAALCSRCRRPRAHHCNSCGNCDCDGS